MKYGKKAIFLPFSYTVLDSVTMHIFFEWLKMSHYFQLDLTNTKPEQKVWKGFSEHFLRKSTFSAEVEGFWKVKK